MPMKSQVLVGRLEEKLAWAVGLPLAMLTYHWLGFCHFMPMVLAALTSAGLPAPKTNMRPSNELAGGKMEDLNHSVAVKVVMVPLGIAANVGELAAHAPG